MKIQFKGCCLALLLGAWGLAGCSKQAPPAEDASATADSSAEESPQASAPLAPVNEESSSYYVEGVAGGVMIATVELQAEVVSVDQEARQAVLRGPEGNEVTVRVGEDAVNFYQIEAGDRVNVTMARELVVYVPEEGDEAQEAEAEPDGTLAAAERAEPGEAPGGAIVASTKVTAELVAMDTEKRTATLEFPEQGEQTFEVRPDVDMTRYEVGQKVVFLVTEYLALDVETI